MEEWRNISGYEGIYQVSNQGRIRNIKTGKILKSSQNAKGYLTINLYKNNKRETLKVHRIVAKEFLSNIEKKPIVSHINNNKKDNRVENLKYSKYSEILKNSNRNNQIKATAKSVICHDTMKVYPSANEAIRDLEIKHKGGVAKCCNAGGLVYSYKLSNYVSFSYFHKSFDYDNYFETGESKYNADLDEYEDYYDEEFDDFYIKI